MSNYKIHIDKPLPDKQAIGRHKNFGRLYGQYETATRFQFWRNLRTNPRYFATLVMIAAVGYLVWEVGYNEEQGARPWGESPIALNLPYEYFELEAGEEMALSLNEHVHVYAPKGSFVDAQGQNVKGTITLAYRELKDARDLFIAGIGMRYVQGKQEELLASGGMIEVLAYKDSQELFLKPGIQLEVSFLGRADSMVYEVYSLDIEARNWVLEGKDSAEVMMDEHALLASLPAKPRAPGLQGVQDLATGNQVDEADDEDLQLVPKGVRPPDVVGPTDQEEVYKNKLAEWQRKYEQALSNMRREAQVLHRFKVAALGYHSLGRILPDPDARQKLKIKDTDGDNFSRELGKAGLPLWLVQEGIFSLRPLTYTGEGSHKATYYSEIPVMLWAVSPEGQLALFSPDDWREMVQSQQAKSISIEFVERPFEQVNTLRDYLDVSGSRFFP